MKKTRLRLKRKVKIYLAIGLNMAVGISAIIMMILSKNVSSFKASLLIFLATMIVESLIRDVDIKKDL